MTSIIHGLVCTDDQYHHYYHHYNFIHRWVFFDKPDVVSAKSKVWHLFWYLSWKRIELVCVDLFSNCPGIFIVLLRLNQDLNSAFYLYLYLHLYLHLYFYLLLLWCSFYRLWNSVFVNVVISSERRRLDPLLLMEKWIRSYSFPLLLMDSWIRWYSYPSESVNAFLQIIHGGFLSLIISPPLKI